jgi:hypothetical protein
MRVGQLINEEAFEPKKHQERKLEAQAVSTRPPKRRRPPRSLPRAQAIGARLGSRTLCVRPIIGLMLLEQLGRQPQSIGVASNFPVHQIPSIWSAPNSLAHSLCQSAPHQLCQKRVLSRLPPNLTSARAGTVVGGGTGAAIEAASGGALGTITGAATTPPPPPPPWY